jgi:DNA-binding protein
MNKSDLVNAVAKKAKISKAAAGASVDSLLSAVRKDGTQPSNKSANQDSCDQGSEVSCR